MDDRIKQHFHHPSGPLALVPGLHKSKDDVNDESTTDGKSPTGRISNKIQIEQLLRLKNKNYATKYMDATLDFVRQRGSDYGLTLSKFINNQMAMEEKDMI